MLKRYIGTKIILAEPLTKENKEGYTVIYEGGYVSWSPKTTFERAYREVTTEELVLLTDLKAK